MEAVTWSKTVALTQAFKATKMDRQAWIEARMPVLTMAETVPRYYNLDQNEYVVVRLRSVRQR